MFIYRAWIVVVLMLAAGAANAQTKLEHFAEGDPNLAKLGGSLLQVRALLREKGVASDQPLAQAANGLLAGAMRGSQAKVIVSYNGLLEAALKDVKAQGLVVVKAFPKDKTISALCNNLAQIEKLAASGEIRLITPEPIARVRAGSVTSQGDRSMNSDLVRILKGVDGSGVTVGVLSDSFVDTEDMMDGSSNDSSIRGVPVEVLTGSAPQASGDLPDQVIILDPGPGEGTDEGVGMAEIVHDVAPGADIFFASAFTGYYEFRDNINNLAFIGANVITDDVMYFEEPRYQDGPIAAVADYVAENGVSYFSAAGNDADQAHNAPFTDSNSSNDEAFPPSGKDLHNFGGTVFLPLDIPFANEIIVTLHWNQPYGGGLAPGPGSAADLDLYLISETALPVPIPNIKAMSARFQGSINQSLGDSVESIFFKNDSSNDTTYYLVIDRAGDPPGYVSPSNIWLSINKTPGVTILNQSLVGDSTIWGHPAANLAMATAAMFYREFDSLGDFQAPAGVRNVEPFSALGGNLPIFFDKNGLGGGGFHPESRFKPDFTAPDGGNTTFFGEDTPDDGDGFPNFFGTSAAAPHAAGVAALLLDLRNGPIDPPVLYQILKDTAVDVEAAGPDHLSGAGFINALAAASSVEVLPEPTPTPGCVNNAKVANMVLPVPTPVAPGTPVTVTITMWNTGTCQWSAGAGYFLNVIADTCNILGTNRIELPPLPAVVNIDSDGIPGGAEIDTVDFQISFTMPAGDPDLCALAFQMFQTGVGEFGEVAAFDLNFNNTFFVDDAVGISTTVPQPGTVICPDAAITPFTVTMKNTGTSTWTALGGYSLLVVSDECGLIAATSVPLDPGDAIAPGQEKTFSLTLDPANAPVSGDGCFMSFRMGKNGNPFGTGIDATFLRTLLSASIDTTRIPLRIEQNDTLLAIVPVTNTGNVDWYAPNMCLVVETNPTGCIGVTIPTGECSIYPSEDFFIPVAVLAPGETGFFLLELTAPNSLGVCSLTLQMRNASCSVLIDDLETVAIEVVEVDNAVIIDDEAAPNGPDFPAMLSTTDSGFMGLPDEYIASITVLNTGSTTWTVGGGYGLCVTEDPCFMVRDSLGAITSFLPLDSPIVPPSGSTVYPFTSGLEPFSKTFTFRIQAPPFPTDCGLTFQMCKGTTRFGNEFSVTVNVKGPVAPNQFNDAFIITDEQQPDGPTIDTSQDTNQDGLYTITVVNTGTTVWTGNNPIGSRYYLAVTNDPCRMVRDASDPDVFITQLFLDPADVIHPYFTINPPPPGAISKTFVVRLKAPPFPTSCALSFQMFQEGDGLFGNSYSVTVDVSGPVIPDACPVGASLSPIPAFGSWTFTGNPVQLWHAEPGPGCSPSDGHTAADGALAYNRGAQPSSFCDYDLRDPLDPSVSVSSFGTATSLSFTVTQGEIPVDTFPLLRFSYFRDASSEADEDICSARLITPSGTVEIATSSGGGGLITNTPDGWRSVTIPFINYIDQSVQLQFSFTANNEDNGHAGWYIDDIRICAIPFSQPPVPIDFTNNANGWTGGVAAGSATTSVTADGLCMSVSGPGDNIALWVSPENYLQLSDNTLYKVTVNASTNQTGVNAIPLWDVLYDNYHALGGGNTFGGEAWFLDNAGGGSGIGRVRSSFDVIIAPNPAQTAQWRGLLSDGTTGAFAPEVDAWNDIRLIIRTLDLGSAGINADLDSGTICIKSILVSSHSISSLQLGATLYNTPISSSTHSPATAGQAPLLAQIDNGANLVNYQLATGDDRATLIPALDLDPPNGVYNTSSLYPVSWTANTIYCVQAEIQAGDGSGSDPLDAIFVNVDTPTNELGLITFSARGSLGNMFKSASPRTSAVAGGPQTYTAYFSGQGGTLSANADDARLRPLIDLFNAPTLNGEGSGADTVQVVGLKVQTVTLP